MAADARSTLEEIIEAGQRQGYVAPYGLIPEYPNLAITEAHGQLLIDSGISSDVASARVYVSILDGRFFNTQIQIPSWVKLAPCLLIPIWDVNGNAGQVQIRPDSPRLSKGKPIKYESLPQSNLRLDIPPAVAGMLSDPKIPLIITEGSRKADAGVTKGAATIGILGVWGFRGKNDKGGKTSLADWERVALNDRKVWIIFDSDVITKSAVAVALQRLRWFLESKGAQVGVAYLPSTDDGTKVGLDDFLKTHAISDLEQFVVEDDGEKKSSDTSYGVVDGRFVLSRGESVEPICNFQAKIIQEEVKDDGLIQRAYYHIDGSTMDKRQLPPVVVSVEDYGQMLWVETEWRTRVQVAAGRAMREHLSAAIKAHSQNAPVKTTFLHCGWREYGDQLIYLHNDGVLPSTTGLDAHVELAGPLACVVLEKPTDDLDIKGIVDEFINLGPASIIVPLLSAVFTAVLGEFIVCDFAIHLEGTTGAYKSELAALVQGFFGREFTARKLPANWSSTANALENQSHAAKDIVFVIDDYAPQPGRNAGEALAQKAEIVFRGAGNQAGRARLTADIKLRPEYFARGLIISTGEDALIGQSLNARVLTLHLNPGEINSVVLSRLQEYRDAGLFSQITRSFIEWLASRFPLTLSDAVRVERDRILASVSLHKRNAAAVAKLSVGWNQFCEFAGLTEFVAFGHDAFRDVLVVQGEIQAEQDLATRSLELLKSYMSSGRVYIEIQDDDGDDNFRARFGYSSIDGGSTRVGTRVGHHDDTGTYLDPIAIHDHVWRFLGRSQQAVRAALTSAGWFETTGKAAQYTVPVRLHGALVRMFKLGKPLYDVEPAVQSYMFGDITTKGLKIDE